MVHAALLVYIAEKSQVAERFGDAAGPRAHLSQQAAAGRADAAFRKRGHACTAAQQAFPAAVLPALRRHKHSQWLCVAARRGLYCGSTSIPSGCAAFKSLCSIMITAAFSHPQQIPTPSPSPMTARMGSWGRSTTPRPNEATQNRIAFLKRAQRAECLKEMKCLFRSRRFRSESLARFGPLLTSHLFVSVFVRKNTCRGSSHVSGLTRPTAKEVLSVKC